MAKTKWVFIIPLIIMLVALPVFAACGKPTPVSGKTVKMGCPQDLTGPYAKDCKATLLGYQDYMRYANEEGLLPGGVTVELLWADTGSETPKILAVYEDLITKGVLLYREHGTMDHLALMERHKEAQMACLTHAPTPVAMWPPGNIFSIDPLYSDMGAAFIDWFMENWEEARAPRFAYLTWDTAFGRSIEIPEFTAYIESRGLEVVGSQYIPLPCPAPPTTQLAWLKENKVDCTFGNMVTPGSEPVLKEAMRLDMGPDKSYKITFGITMPGSIPRIIRDIGEAAEGLVQTGGWPDWTEDLPCVKFGKELQKKYHPDVFEDDLEYFAGMGEAMVAVEAIRLALEEVPFEELKPVDILEAFYKIKDFDTKGITNSPITYSRDWVVGTYMVRISQVQNGKQVKIGEYPARRIIPGQ